MSLVRTAVLAALVAAAVVLQVVAGDASTARVQARLSELLPDLGSVRAGR